MGKRGRKCQMGREERGGKKEERGGTGGKSKKKYRYYLTGAIDSLYK